MKVASLSLRDLKREWRRKWHPTPVFLPGRVRGQCSLVGYSPWGRKQLGLAEQMNTHGRESVCVCVYAYVRTSVCACVHLCVRALRAQSCQSLCNAMDCSPPGSSVHWILQARILEWVAMPFSRGSFRTSPALTVEFFTTWEALQVHYILTKRRTYTRRPQ